MVKDYNCSCENCSKGCANFKTLGRDELNYANKNRYEPDFEIINRQKLKVICING